MTLHFGRFLPGDELMDEETFFALYADHAAAPVRPTAETWRLAARRGGDVSEASEVVRVRPPSRQRSEPVPTRPLRREERAPATPRPPSSPAAAAALEAEIDRCASRDHLVRLAVHLAHAYAPAAALFLVHRGMIERIRSRGPVGSGKEILFPADAPGLFAEVVASGEPFRGAPPRDDLEGRVLRALGRREVREIVVLPVTVGGRVVNLLYADNGPEALGDASVAALAAVCARLSRAYERLILERKAERARSS